MDDTKKIKFQQICHRETYGKVQDEVLTLGKNLKASIPKRKASLEKLLDSKLFRLPDAMNLEDETVVIPPNHPPQPERTKEFMQRLRFVKELKENIFQPVRFFGGLPVPSNHWIIDIMKAGMPIIDNVVTDCGIAKVYISALYQSYSPEDEERVSYEEMEKKMYAKLEKFSRMPFLKLFEMRKYFHSRPTKVLHCIHLPEYINSRKHIIAFDDQFKLAFISFLSDCLVGYAELCCDIKELEQYLKFRAAASSLSKSILN